MNDIKAAAAEFLNWRRRARAAGKPKAISMPKESRYGGSGNAEKLAWEFSTEDTPGHSFGG